MPKDPTPRLNLKNPATGEFDWDKPWWENTKIIDDHPGIKVVTTETLPLNPWPGQVVFNTDSLSLLIWEGSNWLNFSANYLYFKAGNDITKGDLIYINSSGKIENLTQYPANIEEFTRIIGFAVQNISTDSSGLVKTKGKIRLPDLNLNPGEIYYLDESLNLSTYPPVDKNKIIIGNALKIDTLVMNLNYMKI